jgi:putative SOS response-associated peptidase YedK
MCAQFMIHARVRDLAKKLGVFDEDLRKLEQGLARLINKRILPYSLSPVLLCREGKKELIPMMFSLLPRWSKTRKVKFATHNARLESMNSDSQKTVWIYDRPTWRDAFTQRHCIVPMTHFIEPIYRGKWAGNMVRFLPKKGTDEVLCAAGIWEEWIGDDGEVIDSFSIITDDPSQFVRKSGHDRSPLFLTQQGIEHWLDPNPSDRPADLVQLLRAQSYEPSLRLEVDRPLKAGWEKRT